MTALDSVVHQVMASRGWGLCAEREWLGGRQGCPGIDTDIGQPATLHRW